MMEYNLYIGIVAVFHTVFHNKVSVYNLESWNIKLLVDLLKIMNSKVH